MARYVVEVSSPEEAFQRQERIERRIQTYGMERAQLDSALALRKALHDDTEAAGLVDTGLLAASWTHRKTGRGYEVENNAPYAGPRTELGARPFTPPLQPLIDWAERSAAKLGFASGRKRFKGRASLSNEQRQVAQQIARAIQKRYQREGIRPRYMTRNRIPYAVKMLRRSIEEFIDQAASGRG